MASATTLPSLLLEKPCIVWYHCKNWGGPMEVPAGPEEIGHRKVRGLLVKREPLGSNWMSATTGGTGKSASGVPEGRSHTVTPCGPAAAKWRPVPSIAIDLTSLDNGPLPRTSERHSVSY